MPISSDLSPVNAQLLLSRTLSWQTSGMTNPRIAILGWGSLIWDQRPEFDDHHTGWHPDGPVLPLEFSRVSGKTRMGALTLVIDKAHGQESPVQYALSKRANPDDAISDLRSREGTVLKHIGFHFTDGSRKCDPDVPPTVPTWAKLKGLDVVVWTGLPSNFKEKGPKTNFSVEAAVSYLQALSPEAKTMAAEYIHRAPDLVQTSLRKALQTEAWFADLVQTKPSK